MLLWIKPPPWIKPKTLDFFRKARHPRAPTRSEHVLQQDINKLPEHVDDARINKLPISNSDDAFKQGSNKHVGQHDHAHAFGAALDHIFHLPNDLLVFNIRSLVRMLLSGKDSGIIEAGDEMTNQLLEELAKYNRYIYFMFLSGLIITFLAIVIPLVWRFAMQREVIAFISFSHSMEKIAVSLQRELKAKGINVIRVPYKKSAEHQDIVVPVQDSIIKCDAVFCIPGLNASFVESEVMAASTTKKILFFLIGESQGTLPNTADKRYPVFKLEKVTSDKFASSISFLRYCACDFRSTLDVLGKSLSMTVRIICKRKIVISYLFALSLLYAFWYHIILERAAFLRTFNPAFEEVTTVVVQAFFVILGLSIPLASSILLCSLSFLIALVKRIRIQRRIRYRVGLGQFQRNEWIGRAPGLVPGEVLYDSLFEISPVAHHEKAA
jgi:hypothetical protein